MIPSPKAPLIIALAFATFVAVAHTQSLTYPKPKKVDVIDDYFGTKIADPFRWMEDLNAPEVKSWVDAQNAVTFTYLESLGQRSQFQRRITELWNYPRISAPRFEGGRWFYARNTGLQRQSVLFARTALDGPETLVLDPNTFSPDGSIALSAFINSIVAAVFALIISA